MPRVRALLIALAAALAGCGGGDDPQSEVDAVAEAMKSAASAVADRNGEKACSYLTEDGQRQAMLRFGGGAAAQAGGVSCGTFVNRTTVFLTPLDRQRIEDLQPTRISVDGTSASGTLATPAGGPGGQPMSVGLNLQKVDGDWRISGFTDVSGAPGG